MIGIPSSFYCGGIVYKVNKISNEYNTKNIVTINYNNASITVNEFCDGVVDDYVRILRFYDILFSLFFSRICKKDLAEDEELCMAFARHYLEFKTSFNYNIDAICYPRDNEFCINNLFSSFRLGGVTYNIYAINNLENENKGRINTGNCIIQLPNYSKREILTFDDKINTLFHEVIHAISCFAESDIFNDEFVTSALANFLTQYERSTCEELKDWISFDFWSDLKKANDISIDGFLYKSYRYY